MQINDANELTKQAIEPVLRTIMTFIEEECEQGACYVDIFFGTRSEDVTTKNHSTVMQALANSGFNVDLSRNLDYIRVSWS